MEKKSKKLLVKVVGVIGLLAILSGVLLPALAVLTAKNITPVAQTVPTE